MGVKKEAVESLASHLEGFIHIVRMLNRFHQATGVPAIAEPLRGKVDCFFFIGTAELPLEELNIHFWGAGSE